MLFFVCGLLRMRCVRFLFPLMQFAIGCTAPQQTCSKLFRIEIQTVTRFFSYPRSFLKSSLFRSPAVSFAPLYLSRESRWFLPRPSLFRTCGRVFVVVSPLRLAFSFFLFERATTLE